MNTSNRILSVIIPFYQKELGILSRAISSIQKQILPSGWDVEVVVVDDGSPSPASLEISNSSLGGAIFRIVEQPNAGVAAARNRGLDEVSTQSEIIAFLDSDDIWPEDHLARGIEALDLGFDFFFSDNSRELFHESCLDENLHKTSLELDKSKKNDVSQLKTGFISLSNEIMPALIIEEFPTQASTVIYRRSIDPNLRFDRSLIACCEDVLFFSILASKAKKICFNTSSRVKCGRGINIYFGNLGWDSKSFMQIKRDQVLCHQKLAQSVELSNYSSRINQKRLQKNKEDFIFHSIRLTFKNLGKIPFEVLELIEKDKTIFYWFPYGLFKLLVTYPLGKFKP